MAIPKILVVDDDSDVLDMLKQYLVKNALAVHTASTAREVETVVAKNRIDLILLDVMLGDDNGFQICQSLRKENSVPIIMMSALSADHHRMKGYSSGADDYVAKPFNPDLLLARIQAVVRRHIDPHHFPTDAKQSPIGSATGILIQGQDSYSPMTVLKLCYQDLKFPY